MLNISTINGLLINVTYDFRNMESYNVEHICNCGELKNVTYNFGNMEADNVEHLCYHWAVHKCI
jgi:hypothetical protein